MSINTLVTTNTSNNPRRLTPEPFVPVGNLVPPTAYVRPADWPALTTLTSTLNFSGLVAVDNTSMEYIGLIITGTGTLTVDWGDGTSETLTSAVAKQHKYDYATLGTSVTSRGYKTALINVSTTGTITQVNLQTKPVPIAPNNALATNWGPKWLDVMVGGSSLTQFTCGGGTVTLYLLEQAQVMSTSTAFATAVSMFSNCYKFQSAPTLNFNNIGNINGASMFNNCFSLAIAPTFNISKLFPATGLFAGCSSLQVVPEYTLPQDSISTMFQSCVSLRTIPNFDYTGVTNMSSMFNGCTSLESVPNMRNTTSVTSVANMFQNCRSLKNAPGINTINCTAMQSMFSGCNALETVPLYNTANALTVFSMFVDCFALKIIPGPMNLAKVTNLNSMFTQCYSLVEQPILLNTSNVTTTQGTFDRCYALTKTSLFDTSNVTIMSTMYNNAQSLTSVPLFNTSKVTNMDGAFATCRSLKTIPSFNTINVTTFSTTFFNCSSLQTLPTLNTSNALNMNQMFSGCNSLVSFGFIDLGKCTNAVAMFNSCTSLVDASNIGNAGTVNIDMNNMFASSISLNILPTAANLNTSRATNMSRFVETCTSLTTIPTYNTINVINNTNFASSTNSLVTFPALNFSNVTTSGTIATSPQLTTINSTGMKVSHNFSGTSIGSTELTNYMNTGIVGNTTAQTLTISGLPGATTAVVKTSGITANSSVITMANTVGIIAGTTFLYGTGITTGINVSFIGGSPDSTFTYLGLANHGLQNGDSVMFTSFNSNPGLTLRVEYYVVNRTATNFQVSSTPGGTRIILSVTSQGVMSIGGATIANQVNTVTANVSVAINGISQVSNASASLTSRALNQNYATTKNWIITG